MYSALKLNLETWHDCTANSLQIAVEKRQSLSELLTHYVAGAKLQDRLVRRLGIFALHLWREESSSSTRFRKVALYCIRKSIHQFLSRLTRAWYLILMNCKNHKYLQHRTYQMLSLVLEDQLRNLLASWYFSVQEKRRQTALEVYCSRRRTRNTTRSAFQGGYYLASTENGQ